jgi:ferredoxin
VPTVRFAGKSVECLQGANLRSVLVRARLPLYNGAAQAVHCRGLGTCGTCAVHVDGAVSEQTRAERLRLALPPHHGDDRLRLACQVDVLGDVQVTKFQGLFGQHGEPAATPDGKGSPS